MKKIAIRLFLLAALLVTSGFTPVFADGGGPALPSCRPPEVCLAKVAHYGINSVEQEHGLE